MSCVVQYAQSKPAAMDDELFLLDGFDDDQIYPDDQVDGGDHGRGNPLAFPQSDDEEISTDGTFASGWSQVYL